MLRAPRITQKYQAFTLSWLGDFDQRQVLGGQTKNHTWKKRNVQHYKYLGTLYWNPKMDHSIFRCRVSFQECGMIWLAQSLLSPDSRKASLPQSLVVDTPDHHSKYAFLKKKTLLKLQETSSSKPRVRPHSNNTSKQYDLLITRGWMKTLAIRCDFDFKFSGFNSGLRLLGFSGLLFWKAKN